MNRTESIQQPSWNLSIFRMEKGKPRLEREKYARVPNNGHMHGHRGLVQIRRWISCAFGESTFIASGEADLKLRPVFAQQGARFFHACLPDLHHFFVISLVESAIVAVLKMFPH
jgi:hypothetical protein